MQKFLLVRAHNQGDVTSPGHSEFVGPGAGRDAGHFFIALKLCQALLTQEVQVHCVKQHFCFRAVTANQVNIVAGHVMTTEDDQIQVLANVGQQLIRRRAQWVIKNLDTPLLQCFGIAFHVGTIIRQEINDLARRAAGPYAMPFASEMVEGANAPPIGPEGAAPVAAQDFNNRKLSIFGGSNEIQRGIIAKVKMKG